MPQCEPPEKFSGTWDLLYRSFYKYHLTGNIGGSTDFVLKTAYHIDGCIATLWRASCTSSLEGKPTLGTITHALGARGILQSEMAAKPYAFDEVAVIPTKHPEASSPYHIINSRLATYSNVGMGVVLLCTRRLSLELRAVLEKHGVSPLYEWPPLPEVSP